MKRSFFLILMTAFTAMDIEAQHCPYDGSYLIAVYLVDGKGNPVQSPEGLVLKEKQNPLADSCTYAPGQLIIPFAKATDSLHKKYNASWQHDAELKSKDAAFMEPGNYVVVLNMAQNTCMIKNGSGFRYATRVFNIELNGKIVDVPAESIYSLCSDAGKWSRIRSLVVIKD